MIQTISINNFKSFGDNNALVLAPFSVFIGPNGAGKSNLVDAFRFVQDCLSEGIGPAATRRYGWANFRCRRQRSAVISFSFSGVSFDHELKLNLADKELIFAQLSFEYSFSFAHQNDDYIITSETARLFARPVEQGQAGEQQEISTFERSVSQIRVQENFAVNEGPRHQELNIVETNRSRLFTAATFSSLAGLVISDEINQWRFYDPDPRLARSPSLAQNVMAVSETGDTLAMALHQLRRGKQHDENGLHQKLLDLMQVMVPGFEGWETEQLVDGRIAFKVHEKGLRGSLPSLLVSDGTIRLLVILTALFGSQLPPSAIFIEEPERSLHPAVMEQLVDLMREVSAQTQIVVTTHSADFVRYCRPDEVYLLDKVDGCTQIMPASSIEQIDEFLKRFTLDQLWLQGHLERGIP